MCIEAIFQHGCIIFVHILGRLYRIPKANRSISHLYDLALNSICISFIRELMLYVWTFEKIVKILKSMVGPNQIGMIQSLQFIWITCFLLGFYQTYAILSSKFALLKEWLCNVEKTYRHLIFQVVFNMRISVHIKYTSGFENGIMILWHYFQLITRWHVTKLTNRINLVFMYSVRFISIIYHFTNLKLLLGAVM